MITYKVGYVFSLSHALKVAMELEGWNAGKVANKVETIANIYLEGAELVVPKAGTKAAEREPIKLRGGKDGTVAIVGGVRYSVRSFPKAIQLIVDFNTAVRDLVADYELADHIQLSLPTWLHVELNRLEAAELEAGRTLKREMAE